jgi:hypothetical protein
VWDRSSRIHVVVVVVVVVVDDASLSSSLLRRSGETIVVRFVELRTSPESYEYGTSVSHDGEGASWARIGAMDDGRRLLVPNARRRRRREMRSMHFIFVAKIMIDVVMIYFVDMLSVCVCFFLIFFYYYYWLFVGVYYFRYLTPHTIQTIPSHEHTTLLQ